MTEPAYRKKLIEVALPLEAINAASAREKSIRHGHPSTLHLWWARRPLAACRAVIFGQLVDDPSSWPERFPTEEEQDRERARLFKLIGGTMEADYKDGLVAWESSTDERILNAARYEIARSVAWNLGDEPPATPAGVLAYLQEKAPPIYDPFCGGGAIPLEAQRLGLRAFGSDINPIAVLISKALVEIPAKFSDKPPVNPEAQVSLRDSGQQGSGAKGLAQDVRYYGQWMHNEARQRVGHLYPEVEVTAEAVRQQPDLESLKGRELTVIAWIWARTVRSPNPAAKGAQVPLASSFMLFSKRKTKIWVEPVLDRAAQDGYRFEIRKGTLTPEEESKVNEGTVSRSGGGKCILTGAPMPFRYLREQGLAKGLGSRLMAIIADGPSGRVFLPPDSAHETAAMTSPHWEPDGALPYNPRNFNTPNYGLTEYRQLFTARQKSALSAISELVAEVHALVQEHLQSADATWGKESKVTEYADAVATFMGITLDKALTRNCSLTVWEHGMGRLAGTLGRQALPMQWSYAETNPFAGAGGDFSGCAKSVAEVLERTVTGAEARITQKDAIEQPIDVRGAVICTDPPYYDNIAYGDLSDFFYVWARKTLRPYWPNLFRTLLTPKTQELIASPYRHTNQEEAEAWFLDGMSKALVNISSNQSKLAPACIFYAFKQAEVSSEGTASTGWATFLSGITDSDLIVDGTVPVRTEATNALKKNFNALATSVVLVCRRSESNREVTTRSHLIRRLREELPASLRLLQQGNIAPVDMAQSAIGPGMAVFTRYSKVLEADDTAMTVKTALQLINAELDSFLCEQESEFDLWTRFAVTWFETREMAIGRYGEAETLATARGVSVQGVVDAGLLEARAGQVRLLMRGELPSNWDPKEDERPTVWECTQHLIRRLDEGGERAAADLLAGLGSMAEPARDLAYRLFGICERKGWAEEGRAYNGLVVVWPELVRMASETRTSTASQSEMTL